MLAAVSRPTIAIVGGGFSGAAVAFHIARVGTPVLVFEPRSRLGGGLTFGGDDPVHRVNAHVLSARRQDAFRALVGGVRRRCPGTVSAAMSGTGPREHAA